MLLGYEVVEQNDAREQVSDAEVQGAIERNLDTLARNEHLRWNAYHVLKGVGRWDMENPRLEDLPEKDRKHNQRQKLGLHAAIVPYDELPHIDWRLAMALNTTHGVETVPENQMVDDAAFSLWNAKKGLATLEKCNQAKDREFCAMILSNVHCAGRKVVRLQRQS